MRAGIPGADADARTRAQLFLGFTSTQKKALGPELIANTETLPGLTDQWPDGYFRHGTTMHVSHIHEDLETLVRRASRTSGASGRRSGPASTSPTAR